VLGIGLIIEKSSRQRKISVVTPKESSNKNHKQFLNNLAHSALKIKDVAFLKYPNI
jgi:hypothetical protein